MLFEHDVNFVGNNLLLGIMMMINNLNYYEIFHYFIGK